MISNTGSHPFNHRPTPRLIATVFALIAIGATAVYALYASGFGQRGPLSQPPGSDSSSVAFMSLFPSNRLLAPSSIQNFSLVFSRGRAPFGIYSLSIVAPSGMSVSAQPPFANISGDRAAVDLFVIVRPDVLPGNYSVTVSASNGAWTTNQTFSFRVPFYLVRIFADGLNPANLSVRVGSTVEWLNLDLGTDEINGTHTLRFASISLASPPLPTNMFWQHTFYTPGIYRYEDPMDPRIDGEITVVA